MHEINNSGFFEAILKGGTMARDLIADMTIDPQQYRGLHLQPRYQTCSYDFGQPTAQDRWKPKPPEQNERLAPYMDVCKPLGIE